MKWTIEVDPLNPIVPWIEKTFTNRNTFEEYLNYFNVENYKGPGTYICRNDTCGHDWLKVKYEEE